MHCSITFHHKQVYSFVITTAICNNLLQIAGRFLTYCVHAVYYKIWQIITKSVKGPPQQCSHPAQTLLFHSVPTLTTLCCMVPCHVEPLFVDSISCLICLIHHGAVILTPAFLEKVISRLVLAHLNSSTKLVIGNSKIPFPYKATVLRQRGTPSHFLTALFMILSNVSSSQKATSYTVEGQRHTHLHIQAGHFSHRQQPSNSSPETEGGWGGDGVYVNTQREREVCECRCPCGLGVGGGYTCYIS